MRILLGPAGLPLAAKTANTAEGVKIVAELGLQCMEIEFVQQVYLQNEEAKIVGKVAKENGVQLSVHAPYYINLASEKKAIVEASKKRILQSVERAHYMQAKIVVIHAGYYGKLSPQQTFERICAAFEDIAKEMKKNSWDDVLLGCETTAKRKQWGTLQEVLEMRKAVDLCYPYIDFAHLFARAGEIDYEKILKILKKEKIYQIFSHFEGLQQKAGRFVDVHTAIDNPPFEPLAEAILKQKRKDLVVSIICESPLLEEDALKMKKIFEKLGYNFI
jgi:deoxyribonuclease-4